MNQQNRFVRLPRKQSRFIPFILFIFGLLLFLLSAVVVSIIIVDILNCA